MLIIYIYKLLTKNYFTNNLKYFNIKLNMSSTQDSSSSDYRLNQNNNNNILINNNIILNQANQMQNNNYYHNDADADIDITNLVQ